MTMSRLRTATVFSWMTLVASFTAPITRNMRLARAPGRVNRLDYEKGDADTIQSNQRLKELEAEYWASLSAEEREAQMKIRAGLELLKSGDFNESLANFDRALG